MNTARAAAWTCGFLHSGAVAATQRLHTVDGRFIHACDAHASQHGHRYARAEALAPPRTLATRR